jgi:NADPH:quinone reductase-like Zn-dependent oxidoreductase
VLSQDVSAVLAAEYPAGVDVVYEGVGGALRAAILPHLAPNGRLLQVRGKAQGRKHSWVQLVYGTYAGAYCMLLHQIRSLQCHAMWYLYAIACTAGSKAYVVYPAAC